MLLLLNARLWDGTGEPVREGVDILVDGDRVVEIGDVAPQEGWRVIDVAGDTVIPGLVDGHVHLTMDPGAHWRDDSPETHRALMRQHLRAYLACGVTTVLDPAVLPAESALVAEVLAGEPGPRYLHLGAPFSPPDGYVAVVVPGFPTVATPADVARHFDTVVSQGAVGIKTTVEAGFGRPIWPLHTPEVFDAIREGAAARGLPVYAHAIGPDEHRLALERLAPKVMVHPPDRYDPDVVALAAAKGVYEMTTLSTVDSARALWDPARLADPLVRLVTPEVELATAADPVAQRGYARAMVAAAYPRMPLKGLAAAVGFNEGTVRRRLARTAEALRALRDAGVPIVMGSDSGNWPVIPVLFHGPSSVREVELLVEAGLTPEEALIASTRTPGRMLGLANTIAPGNVADLVVVDGDPLADVSALRSVRYTVRAGVARTPEEWME
ncbi:MAG: amidohydrolase family protein [Myxococcota bacterium]